MWRCSYCWRRFEDRDDGINHARAQHSRDYTTCEYVPQRPRESGALQPAVGVEVRGRESIGPAARREQHDQ